MLVQLYVTFSMLTDYRFYVLLCGWLRDKAGFAPATRDTGNTASHDDYPQIPVDLVYTWVDGSDPVYLESRAWWVKKLGLNSPVSMNPIRFTDHNELKLSLRSAEAFLPWVRTVFIVTNAQVPQWLDTQHPKIKVVDAASLFPNPDYAPTFNSHAIEFQLHRIPGLSENFIYCNDDMFFGRPCSKSDFFAFPDAADEKASQVKLQFHMYIFPAVKEYALGKIQVAMWRSALCNLRFFLEMRFPLRKISQNFLHQAAPLKKSILQQAQDDYPALYEQISSTRFRSSRDIPPVQLASHLALITGRGVLRRISEQYFYSLEAFRRCVLRGELPKLCCLNDLNEQVDLCDVSLAADFCRKPSAFEKP